MDKEDWKKFEQHNKETALNVLFVPHNKNKFYNLCRFRMSIKKSNIVKIILKIITHRKKLSTNPQDTHSVQYVHLMIQKTNTIFIGERIVMKSFVKI